MKKALVCVFRHFRHRVACFTDKIIRGLTSDARLYLERLMASHDYEFVSFWNVIGTSEEVYDILINGLEYPRWWPEVYLDVEQTSPGSEHGLGKAGRLLTKGKLPYTLRWSMVVTAVNYPNGFTLQASGDFNGVGIWTFTQNGPAVMIRFDWKIRVEKTVLKHLSFLMKPIFRANHRWAMRRGSEALRVELLRRRAQRVEF